MIQKMSKAFVGKKRRWQCRRLGPSQALTANELMVALESEAGEVRIIVSIAEIFNSTMTCGV